MFEILAMMKKLWNEVKKNGFNSNWDFVKRMKKLIDFNPKGMNLRRKWLGFGWEIKNRMCGRKGRWEKIKFWGRNWKVKLRVERIWDWNPLSIYGVFVIYVCG